MQTATATSPRRAADKAFNRLAELKPSMPPPEPEDRRERYFFFAGDFPGCPPVVLEGPDGKPEKIEVGGTTVDTRCIPDKVLWRCLVTPCTTTPVNAPFYAIPDGRKLHGTEMQDKERNIFAAKMLEFSGPAGDCLIAELGTLTEDLDKKRGLVEIAPEMIRGKPFEEVREYNLTFLFFPNWPYDVPKTHAETRAKIEDAIALIERNEHPDFPFSEDPAKRVDAKGRDTHWIKKLYLQAGADMLRAVNDADAWHTRVADRANVDVARSDTDAKHKEGFDTLDAVAFMRTGIIQTTKQMQEMVKASRDNRGANDKVAEAVLMMAQTLNQQQTPQVSSEVEELRRELAEMKAMLSGNAKPSVPKVAIETPKAKG